MSDALSCNWPKSYLHITDNLMKDQTKAARARERQAIKQMLQNQLAKNTTKTMTFTENGLMLAIQMIDELD
jgi:hypothetical protein